MAGSASAPEGLRGVPPRRLLVVPLLLVVAIPLALLLVSWLDPQPSVWAHLREHLLGRLVGHTFWMVLVVGTGVTVLGVGLAWLSACCDYPLRRWLDPLLILPLAFPPYVLAFIYLGLLDYAGPVQGAARDLLGTTPGFIQALGRPGGVLPILILAFYPYVYLLARASFLAGGLSAFEAGRSLGQRPWQVFLRISLPAARPAIVAGLALALMETLADFGAVAIYGFDTFTTAVYRTWLGLMNLTAATQLASLLMMFMLVLLIAERLTRSRRARQSDRQPGPHRIVLSGWRRWAAPGLQLAVLLAGVIIPVVQLAIWAAPEISGLVHPDSMRLIANTMILGAAGAALVLAGGLVLLAATHRAGPRFFSLSEVAAAGYAIPGSVLAVAIMLGFTGLDRIAGTALAGGLAALLLAYLVRFLRVAWGPLEGVAVRFRPEYIEVARSLGIGRVQRWWRVALPLLRPGLVTAFLLAAVEIAKEMPATLMLRPFGWETLAVRIFELTMEGQWERAALPALVLVILGAIPAVLLIRRTTAMAGRSG